MFHYDVQGRDMKFGAYAMKHGLALYDHAKFVTYVTFQPATT